MKHWVRLHNNFRKLICFSEKSTIYQVDAVSFSTKHFPSTKPVTDNFQQNPTLFPTSTNASLILCELKEIISNPIDDPTRFNFILQNCVSKLTEFNTTDLVQLITHIRTIKHRSKHKKNHELFPFLSKLNQECIRRSFKLSLNSKLDLAEALHLILKRPHFLNSIAKRHLMRLDKESTSTIIRLIKIMNKCDKWKKSKLFFRPYEIECHFEKRFHTLNYKEILIFANAFFIMDSSIVSYNLKKEMLLYFLREMNNMDHLSKIKFLVLFCRIPYFTSNMKKLTPEVNDFVDKCNEDFDNLHFSVISAVCMLTTKFLLHKPDLLDKAYNKFLQVGSRTRLCNVESLIYSLTYFNYSCDKKVFEILDTEPLKRSLKQSKRYLRILSWLSIIGVNKIDILDRILAPEFLDLHFKDKLFHYLLYPEMYRLDMALEIEYPEYKGNRLPSSAKKDLQKCYNWDWRSNWKCPLFYTDPYEFEDDETKYKISTLPYDDILKEVQSIMNIKFGGEYTYLSRMLIHFPKVNLIFGLDANKCAKKLELGNGPWINWKELDNTLDWYVVTVLIRNELSGNDVMPLGEEIGKIRQFKKLNFNVISIVQDEWLVMDLKEKQNFLNNCI